MLKKHRLFTILYSVIILLNVFATALNDDTLRLIGMPLIGISNILYLLIMTRLRGTFNLKIFLSLMFAMGGDILLLFDSGTEFFFLTAVIATFTGYLLAVTAFYEDTNKENLGQKNAGFYANIFFILISGGYYIFLRKYIGEYKIPVIIHFFILTLLFISAFFRYNKVNLLSFRLIVLSAICFTISDYCIAYSSFVHKSTVLMVIYILAYMMAQYLLVTGSIERKVLRQI